jgi:hypothetical protein
MLLASENDFFSEAKPCSASAASPRPAHHQAPRVRSMGLDSGWAEISDRVWGN